ncbi:hypothetical protein K3495_g5633 [Podosphaera aphanis]|nr:hypothetical protein K3495_g5633 [Podosphaera aphanis]
MCFRRSARLTAAAAASTIKEKVKKQTVTAHVKEKTVRKRKLSTCNNSHLESGDRNGDGVTAIASEATKMKRASSVVTKFSIQQASIPNLSPIKIVTENELQNAIAHIIKIEPKLKSIIEQNPCHLFSSESLAEEIEPFKELSCSIISQQVSCAAAKSIQKRFVALFTPLDHDTNSFVFPTPHQVHITPIEVLRTAGLSQRKAEYVKGLAEKFYTGELDSKILLNASYEDVFDALIQVRGLGKWSVEMFACFGLKQFDIFSTGDLGVQRGMALLSGKNVDELKKNGGKWKYMHEKEMEEMANKFKPYRSVFMWYTWRVEQTLAV